MLFKIFNLQKHIRDISETAQDPTYVHTIISEIILKTFTLFTTIVVLGTVAFGVLGVVLKQPGWWIVFAIGCLFSIAFMVIRWVVQTIIRRAVTAMYQGIQRDTIEITPEL